MPSQYYASLWERLSLYWSCMLTSLRELEACIHRWTSSEACRAVNLLLLDRWTQASISKYLVEQSPKSPARNVTPSREHFDLMAPSMASSLALSLAREAWPFWPKLAQISSSWPKSLQVGPSPSKLAQVPPSWPKSREASIDWLALPFFLQACTEASLAYIVEALVLIRRFFGLRISFY